MRLSVMVATTAWQKPFVAGNSSTKFATSIFFINFILFTDNLTVSLFPSLTSTNVTPSLSLRPSPFSLFFFFLSPFIPLSLSLSLSLSFSAVQTCPMSWSDQHAGPSTWFQFGGSCYKFFSYGSMFQGYSNPFIGQEYKATAARFCLAVGGHLVDIESPAENEFVRLLIPSAVKDVYIGYQRDLSGGFIWDRTHKQGKFAHWNPGEPKNIDSGKGCVEMEKSMPGRWNSVSCRRSLPLNYVCKKGREELSTGALMLSFQHSV